MILGKQNDNVELLSNIQVPSKYYRRIKTGVQTLDEIFGGTEMPGLAPFECILFTGMPGAGKTTMVMQIADLIQKNEGFSILYNAGEQNKYIVKMNADRMNLTSEFCVSQFSDVNDLIDYVINHNIDMLIVDSIQTLSDGDLEGTKLLKSVGDKLASLADKHSILTILVGHITKGGDFAGPMVLKHTVDVHAHMSFNKETGNRIFSLQKNRFGPAMMSYEFYLGSDGMNFKHHEDESENNQHQQKSRNHERKEVFLKKAKELLLMGKKLSGYPESHKELQSWMAKENWDCSGIFWRGIIARAGAELEREGHIVGRKTINRREHIFVEV